MWLPTLAYPIRGLTAHPFLHHISEFEFVPYPGCQSGSDPGRGRPLQPPRTRGGWRDNTCHRVRLLPTCSGHELADTHECPQGPLLLLGLQAHPLSTSCKTTHSRALALGCGRALTLSAFRKPPALRPPFGGAVDHELLDFHAPRNEAACGADSPTEPEDPR